MKDSPTPARGFIALVCFGALAFLLIDGCKKDDPVSPQDPGGGGGGGGTVTSTARFAALAAFESFADSLDYTNPNVYLTIRQYFRSHSETYEASDTTGPRCVWARFKDGRIFIVSDDTETRPDTSGMLKSAVHHPKLPPGRVDNLPTSKQARIINALGPAFDPIFGTGAEETVNDLRSWLSAAGYTVLGSRDASVQGLKQVAGDGVFYLSSHGSWGEARGGQTAYGIWTTDEVTPANDTLFSADLNSSPPRLCWYRALDNNNIIGQNRKTHYAITGQFVRDYMSFQPHSLVFFNACRSDAPENPEFKAACIAKNAGVYLGWSNNINCQTGLNSARFFFDRLLGAHQQPPAENPPQRPFEITYVLEDMLLRGYDEHSTAKGLTNLFATPPYGYGGEPTLLAPTIQNAIPPFIPGDVNILIDGSYDLTQSTGGTVWLGANQLQVLNWSSFRIECPAPQSGGNLMVKIDGIKSNTIQLTEWHAQFTLVYRGRGSLQHRITMNLNFYADVHNWRVLPHKPANFWAPRYTYVMGNSSCQFESSGRYLSELDTSIVIEQWSNAVVPQLSRTLSEATCFGMTGTVDSVGRATTLFVVFRGEFTRYLAGSGTTQEVFSPPGVLTVIPVSLTGGYAFLAGSIPWSAGENSATMTWGNMPPTYPPNPAGGW